MPANLTPQYLEAERRFRSAVTVEEKISALRDMYRLIPKHKGTEKLRADIKKKLSQFRREASSKKGPQRKDPSNIPREGAGRIVLVGPPNGGKSSILKAMTNAEPDVQPWPFTTRVPEQGMVEWEDIQFQLIDIPAINEEYMEWWVINLVRSADLLLLVVDHSHPGVLEDIDSSERILKSNKVLLYSEEEELPEGLLLIPTILVVNKMDLLRARENVEVIEEFFSNRFKIMKVSCSAGTGFDELKTEIFKILSIIRVYTKIPGHPPDMKRPFVLKSGATVEDLCRQVHEDFVETVKFARVWGMTSFDGRRVTKEYQLHDGEVVELHR